MLYLKNLKLNNYCSYKGEHNFSFLNDNEEPYKFVCFFGPNGIGKSVLLNAISMLTMNTVGRGESNVRQSLRKFVWHPDYDPMWQSFKDKKFWEEEYKEREMLVEGTYLLDGKEYVVSLTQNGYARNDFAPVSAPDDEPEEKSARLNSGPWKHDHLLYRQRISHFLQSKASLALHKIQIHESQTERFEKVISEIMRYTVECLEPQGMSNQEVEFCTDIIVHKRGTKVHFKSLSEGEKKICKSFSDLLNLMVALGNPSPGEPAMEGWPRLILLDEFDQSIYYDRHVTFVECLKDVFEGKQIFGNTHSGVLIPRYLRGENNQEEELYIDLEPIVEG